MEAGVQQSLQQVCEELNEEDEAEDEAVAPAVAASAPTTDAILMATIRRRRRSLNPIFER